MVLLTVVGSEGEQVLEGGNVVSEEDTVISLADGGNINIMERHSEPRLLSSIKLFIVINCVEVTRWYSSLLNSLLVMDGSKDLMVPFTEGLPVLQTVVKVEQSVANSDNEEEIPDE